MTHPDETTLYQWLDGELPPGGHRDEVAAHVEGCERCAAVVAGARGVARGLALWADDLKLTTDDLADAVFRATPKPVVTDAPAPAVAADARPPASEEAPSEAHSAKVVPLRRWVWPALAAAAALVVWATAGRTPAPGTRRPGPVAVLHDAAPEPVELASAAGVDVVSIDVVGAKSYAVLEVQGSRPGATTAVVWIQDEPDDSTDPNATTVQ